MFKKIFQDFSLSATVAGIVAILISFSGPSIIIFQAARAAELSPDLLSSWIFAISIASGVAGLALSLKFKMPIICAWSTPGAALLVLSLANYSYQEAIGAFILSSILIILSGVTGLFKKVINRIPIEIGSALLAGILLRFGIDLFTSLENNYMLFLIMFSSYFIVKRWSTRYTVIVSLLLGSLYSVTQSQLNIYDINWEITNPILTLPEFSLKAFLGLSLPILIVTMISQNVPGITVLKSAGYKEVPINSLISVTGLMSLLFAPFGSHAVNLAAITAAICTNEESHKDKSKRYISGLVCGLLYIVVGLFSGVLISLFFIIPEGIIIIITGLALLSTIISSLSLSVSNENIKESAVITFLATASNFSISGIDSAFWGIIIGISVYFLKKR